MSLRGATFLGVGSMVGAGIFALLGEAGAVAGAATWLSFLLAGVITLLLGYTIARLGARYPSSGGFITYLREGYGDGNVLGVASWLGYFAMVIMAAMVAVSFGEYTSSLLLGDNAAAIWVKIFASVNILLMLSVSLRGSAAVDKAQTLIVISVLSVFAVFIVATFSSLEPELLDPADYPSFGAIVSSIALTFFAFLGFSVITFSAGDLENPSRDLPRATYLAISIAMAVYVAVSLGVFGVLGVDEVVAEGSTAIAVAAEPVLGQFGFVMISIAAMLATSSSTNANLYAADRLTRLLGQIGQFPAMFAGDTKRGRPAGLMLTVVLVLVMANGLDLTAIASVGTVVALALFLLLCVAGIRLRGETRARVLPMLLAIAAILVVITQFVLDTLTNDPATFVVMLILIALAFVCNFGWKAFAGHTKSTSKSVAR